MLPDARERRDVAAGGSRASARPGAAARPAPSVCATAAPARAQGRVSRTALERLAGRRHTVRAGETLWGIATATLRPGAGDAAIAAAVARLWELNAPRIGSGDPNLLPAGVVLRLPTTTR